MISQLASLMILMCQLREERQRIQAKQLEAEARAQRTDENSIEMRKMRMKETIQRGLKKNITWICRVWFSSTHFLFCLLVPCLPFALPWRLRALGVRFYECNGRKRLIRMLSENKAHSSSKSCEDVWLSTLPISSPRLLGCFLTFCLSALLDELNVLETQIAELSER